MENEKQSTFAIVGLGFISDRHIAAIKSIQGKLVAGCDIDKEKRKKIGDAPFYDNYKWMLEEKFDYAVICTPNYLHYPMALDAIKSGHKVILEKPAVIKLEHLKDLQQHSSQISNIFQLRYNPELIALKESIDKNKDYKVEFEVCVHRGDWYFDSWKNKKEQSGGLMFNIGVHYFDLLCWLFGEPKGYSLAYKEEKKCRGRIWFENAKVDWKLSIDQPMDLQWRHLKINGETINLSINFESLYSKMYQEILNNNRITLEDAETTIKLLNDYDKNT